jgi:HAD superfamily phosphoserine phosphatase-like hydrolase
MLDLHEVKKQLDRMNSKLQTPLILIGGLAVNQHVVTRESKDIDLVCSHNVALNLIKDLYPSDQWKIVELNKEDTRPSFVISNEHNPEYPKINFGPKILERGGYDGLQWESLKRDARGFEFKKATLDKILVPCVESLIYSKIISLIGRDDHLEEKLRQDFWDIKNLANLREFRMVTLNDIMKSAGIDLENCLAKFHSRVASLGEDFDGFSVSSVGKFFSKPSSPQSPSVWFPAVTNAKTESNPPDTVKPRRLVAFDLDGTLIKGIRHSWTVVWNHIMVNRAFQTNRKADFQNLKLSYGEWCRLDGEELRKGGLQFQHFDEIAKSGVCSSTKNLTEAIVRLRENGFRTAIISGGIDALLYSIIPNADELFDDIFINRFLFRDNGKFHAVVPTEYDWDEEKRGVVGKRRGLERLCQKYSVELVDAVFVGDDLNDLDAMHAAGTKIYYCNDSREFETGLPHGIIHIPENDLMKVADKLLSPSPAPL